MPTLVVIRHGQSVWNLENRFTGWTDVPLSKKGISEAKKAGKLLKDYHFDVVFISHLLRSIETFTFAYREMGDQRIPVIRHETMSQLHKWENYASMRKDELMVHSAEDLAERYYGKLQGMNKDDMRKKYGAEQVHIWRRSFDVRPPGGESLKDTIMRTLPYYKKHIEPALKAGKTVLIVAHGNSLRSIVKHIESISDDKIPLVEIPTGEPIVYEFDTSMKLKAKKVLK